jgi:hypothetical protein
MLILNLDLKEETEKKLKKIWEQYKDKELFARSIIGYEISELKRDIINMQIDLKYFEDKYKIPTKDFYEKFECGELGDEEDHMIWAGIYESILQNRKRLEELVVNFKNTYQVDKLYKKA